MSRMFARRLWAVNARNGWNGAGTKGPPTGLLVVRIWREQNADPVGISARITSTVDVRLADDRTLVVTSADEIRQSVGEWLQEYLVQYPRHC